MGLLVNGEWKDRWYDTKSTDGKFVRENSSFRNWVQPIDSGSSEQGPGEFVAEPNRYHLFVSYACPWAHRTLIFRKLKKLEEIISVTVVKPDMLENGWEFETEDPTLSALDLDVSYLHQVYSTANPNYSGRVTVPVLWDKKNRTIVSNESSEIIRMLNSSFGAHSDVEYDFYPMDLRNQIDSINETVYENINNGVYRCGFATTQSAYEEAFTNLFGALDQIETVLSKQRYLVGSRITEADWRLFTTLIRFDAVYFGHFKTNRNRIVDFPNLSNYVRELFQVPGIKETVRLDHIKRHYYFSHKTVNPTGIVPLGPDLNFDLSHDRDRFQAEPF